MRRVSLLRSSLIAAFVATLLVVGAAIPAIAKEGTGQGGPSDSDDASGPGKPNMTHSPGSSGKGANASDNSSHGQGQNKSADHGPDGGYAIENGSYQGRYVSFELDEESGSISDYSVGNVTYFDSIELPGSIDEAEVSAHGKAGGEIELRGDGWSAEISDKPTGTLSVSSGDHGDNESSFTFHLAGDASVEDGNSSAYHIALGNSSALLVAKDASVDGSSITVTGGGFFHAPASSGEKPGSENRGKIDDAIAEDKVGAEVDVDEDENGDLDTSETDFSGMELNMTRDKQNGTLTLLLDANITGPKLLVLNINEKVLGDEDFMVSYFDVESGNWSQVPITKAESLDAILDLEAGGTLPTYWPVKDENGHQIILYIPHFSVHAFVVQPMGFAASVAQPSVILGVVGGMGVAAGAAAMLLIRRRDDEDSL